MLRTRDVRNSSTRRHAPRMTTVLSWNIALCKPSNEAKWDHDENTRRIEQAITDSNADILSIQEAPSDTWSTSGILGSNYTLVGSVKTHCGFTMILVKATKQALRVHIEGAPAIGALVDGVVYVAMHLMPHKNGLYCRMQQMQNILASTPSSVRRCVIVGDSNMRNVEGDAIENLGLADAWKQSGGCLDTEYTWNSRINRYHKDGFEFVCRFDRAYLRETTCTDFNLISNTKKEGAFLSDHFGILLNVTVD